MEPIKLEISVDRIRNLGYRKDQPMSTPQAEAFLCLYREQIKDTLDNALKNFVSKKLGRSAGTI